MHRPSLLHPLRRLLGRPNLRRSHRLLKRQPQTAGRPLRLHRFPMRLEPRLPKLPIHPIQPSQHPPILLHRQLPQTGQLLRLELPLEQPKHAVLELRSLQHFAAHRRLLPHQHQRHVGGHRPDHGRFRAGSE